MGICKNLGIVDRSARCIIGANVMSLGITLLLINKGGTLGLVLAVAGPLLIINAATGVCLLYKSVNFSTLKTA